MDGEKTAREPAFSPAPLLCFYHTANCSLCLSANIHKSRKNNRVSLGKLRTARAALPRLRRDVYKRQGQGNPQVINKLIAQELAKL